MQHRFKIKSEKSCSNVIYLTWTIQKQLGRLIKKVLEENEKKKEDESNKNTSHPNSLSSLDLKLNCVKINLI